MKVIQRRGLLIDVFDIKEDGGKFYLASSWRDPVDGETRRHGLAVLSIDNDVSVSLDYVLSGKEAYKVELSEKYLVLSGTGLWIYGRKGEELIPLKEEYGTLVVDVKILGDVVYAVVGSVFSTYLVAYEITPYGVEDVGMFFDENMSGVFVIDDSHIAVRSGADVIVIDVSDPSNLREVERYEDVGILLATQRGGIAAIKKGDNLKIYKLPEKKYLGMVRQVGDVVSSFIDGYALYVLKNTGEIEKYAPGDDRFLMKVDGFPTTIYEKDGMLLVGFEREGLMICRSGKIRYLRSFNPWRGSLREENKLILSSVEGVVNLDISSPDSPSEISRASGFWAWHLEEKEEYLYVGGIWSSRGGDNIIREFFKGRILYNGLVILKKEGDGSLAEVKRIRLPETKSSFTTYDMYINGDILFAISDAGIVVMDIKDRENPNIVFEKRGINARYMWFEENYGYVHLYPSGDVIVYKIEKDSVKEVGFVGDVGYVKVGYNAFGGRSGIRYISVEENGMLKIIGVLDIGVVEAGTTDGKRLYVSSYHEDKHKLWIIDGSNVAEYETPRLKNLIVKDGYLFASVRISEKEWDVVKYDVSRELREVDRITGMGDIFNDVIAVGDYLYYLDGRRGIAILEV